jgi:hypothetical protein
MEKGREGEGLGRIWWLSGPEWSPAGGAGDAGAVAAAALGQTLSLSLTLSRSHC